MVALLRFNPDHMPSRRFQFRFSIGLALKLGVCCIALTGCYDAMSDSHWATTVPGIYFAHEPGFREVLELDATGTFRHEVIIGGQQKCIERGSWSYDVSSGAVRLEPFTSFFDQSSRERLHQGMHHSSDKMFVLRYGSHAERISPSTGFDYYLLKQTNSIAGASK